MAQENDFFSDLMSNIGIIQTAAVIGLLLFIFYYYLNINNLPPGPWGIPFLGYWPFLRIEAGHLQLQELTEKYGEVFSFTASGNLFICLNSCKALKAAHVSNADCFGDRFTDYSLLTLSFEEAVSIVNGESWRVQRKFFAQKFKEYGLLAVKENTSGSFYDALSETVEEMRSMDGQPFEVTELMTVKCSKIIRRILFNDQGITEEELGELNHVYGTVLASMNYKNLLLMGNFARYAIFPLMPSYWAMIKSHNHIQKILTNVIKRHKLSFDETQIMDIIDCFYKEKRDKEIKGDPTARHFTDKALLSSIYQFVTDGVLTVSFFIAHILQSLIEHPEEQDKIYEELVEVVGTDRQPTIEDRIKLPYTNSFIYEVIRFSNSFPLFPSLKCTKETFINGYRCPKGAITVVNVYSAHHDPDTYEDPYKFDAARFMAKPGKQKPDMPIMFGVGKRACMGEPFTMIQTFLFLATIVKNFRLSLPDGANGSQNYTLVGTLTLCAHPRTQESKVKN